MQEETVVSLPNDVRDALNHLVPKTSERDDLVAAALRAYIAWPQPGEDASGLAIIDAHADELNSEAEDALRYGSWPTLDLLYGIWRIARTATSFFKAGP